MPLCKLRCKHFGVQFYPIGACCLGGFHHFLLVRAQGDKVAVEVKKVGAPTGPLRLPTNVAPGTLLESWEQGLVWYPWDYTVTAEITTDRASEGNRKSSSRSTVRKAS